MIQRIKTGYIVELAAGHFVPKGVVPVSKYIFDENGTIMSIDRKSQESCFDIIDGAVLKCVLDPPYSGVEGKEASEIVAAFSELLIPGRVIEFGRKINPDDGVAAGLYLIDYGDDEATDRIESSQVHEGIISAGRIAGRVVRVADASASALHAHLGDKLVARDGTSEGPIVYVAKYPSIELAHFLEGSCEISFIFEQGSMLCHLALLLRERQIPAIISATAQNLVDGQRLGN
jgi:hypothetical protein